MEIIAPYTISVKHKQSGLCLNSLELPVPGPVVLGQAGALGQGVVLRSLQGAAPQSNPL
jgi:hypothetical protein